jgi:phosphopentomutase
MAKTKSSSSSSNSKIERKISRPGVHSKKKNSRTKSSKNYTKPYNGQGR